MEDTSGYPVEYHEVQTEDGYILTLIRVRSPKDIKPNSINSETLEDKDKDKDKDKGGLQDQKNEKTGEKSLVKPAVLIVHGFQCSSADWFMNTPDNSLPYQLVNAGYNNVWIANLRGTPLSRGHISLRPNSRKYWDFGFHEMSAFDFPAIINYVYDVTGRNVFYIGHSMGCSIFFAGISIQPSLNLKIDAMAALAPAVYANNFLNKPIKLFIAPLASFFGKIKRARQKQAFPKPIAAYVKAPFKGSDKLGGWLARRYGVFVGGIGTDQIEKERMEKIARHWPSSTSVKTMCHGMQCINRKAFANFDYGRSENLKRYGQATPPLYDLTKVSVLVATFHAKDDRLCSSQDVTQLSKDLPNVIGNFGITHPKFTHGDFLFGKDANKLVYQPVIEIFEQIITKNEADVELQYVTKL